MIRTLQSLCERSRYPSESKYPFILLKPYGIGIKSIKCYQPIPAVLLGSLINTLMLLGMNLTSTTTFKETRMTVLQFLQTAKEKKNSAMLVKN